MKAIRRICLLLLSLMLAKSVGAGVSVYSADSDVRALSRVTTANFGPVGMYGATSAGEIWLRRILRKDEPLKYFMEVYNSGTPAAKVYALAYFHHSAPELFQICWKDIVGKYNPEVKSVSGCFLMQGSLLEHMLRIREGEYDPYVEEGLLRAERAARK